MSPENSIIERIRHYQSFVQTPESISFDDKELFDCLSPHNQTLLLPVRQEIRVYNACLNSVTRWKDNPVCHHLGLVGDTDYEHVLNMLKISRHLEELGLSGINFDEIQLLILFHDGGEIITDDIALINSKKDKDDIFTIKKWNQKPLLNAFCHKLNQNILIFITFLEIFILDMKIETVIHSIRNHTYQSLLTLSKAIVMASPISIISLY